MLFLKAMGIIEHVAGPRWLVFSAGTVSGLIVWGEPQPDDAARVLRAVPASLSRGPTGYFIDARRLAKGLDPRIFSPVLGGEGASGFQSVERCAIAVSSGAEQLTQYFSSVDTPFDVSVCEDAAAALRFAGAPMAVQFLATLDALVREAGSH